MSGIAGILRRDGSPSGTDSLRDMTARMVHRGPDGIHHWTDGPVGLGHCMLRTTAASLDEVQPARHEAAGLAVTFDGRIDNRGELWASLGDSKPAGREASDSQLILSCYARWGTDGIARLLGDFAFALWDGPRRRLVCARDFLGKRPFYYSIAHDAFRFASELGALLADPAVSREPNLGMVGEFLAGRPESTDETLFRDLSRLPPAHFLIVTAERSEIRRYWDWDPNERIRYSRDEEYADHLLELGAAAVEDRLDSPWPVAAALSGGIDSSSVVGLVEHLRHVGRYRGQLELFGMVYPGLSCDESPYIRDFAALHGLRVTEVEPGPVGADPYEDQVRWYHDLPDYPNTMMHRSYWGAAKERGCRTLLTGKGPDEWLSGSDLGLADRIRRLQLRAGVEEVRSAAGPERREMAIHFWRYGIKPQVPGRSRTLLRSALGRTVCPPFVRASFCHEVELEDRLRARGPALRSGADSDLVHRLTTGWLSHANEFDERAMASVGLEPRDPLDDRRIVEFALGIPEDQRRRAGITKVVLRNAVRGLIPQSVASRRDKADYAHLFAEELLRQGGRRLFTDLESARRGWVDQDRVLAMYDHLEGRYLGGSREYVRYGWSLWVVLSLDRWLRTLS